MSYANIEVTARDTRGKNANRQLRASGHIPAVVYGGGKDPLPIQIEERKLEELLKSAGGENLVFLLELAGTGKSRHTMIRELQRNSVTGEMIHVDFLRVMLDQKVRVSVPIVLHGESVGVKTEGGFLDFVTREVEVFCLPEKIPTSLEIAVDALHIGQHLEAGDLELPEDVELHVEPERVLVSVAAKKGAMAEEEAPEEEEELLEKISAEPEVIQRGPKTEDEG